MVSAFRESAELTYASHLALSPSARFPAHRLDLSAFGFWDHRETAFEFTFFHELNEREIALPLRLPLSICFYGFNFDEEIAGFFVKIVRVLEWHERFAVF